MSALSFYDVGSNSGPVFPADAVPTEPLHWPFTAFVTLVLLLATPDRNIITPSILDRRPTAHFLKHSQTDS